MSCPRCGGTPREMIGPALFRCTNMLYDRVLVPPPIGRPFDVNYQDVAFNCGNEYREGNALADQNACPEHGLFSSGVCGECRSTVVCVRCGRLKCRACRIKDEATEAEAYRARRAEEEAERKAKEDEHAAVVAAKAEVQPKSQQQYAAELRSLDRKLVTVREKLRKSVTVKFSIGYALSALVGLGFWIVALIIIVKTPVKVISLFPFGIGLAFMSPIIMWTNGVNRKSKEALLKAERDLLLLELGCGEDCEYGCRKY